MEQEKKDESFAADLPVLGGKSGALPSAVPSGGRKRISRKRLLVWLTLVFFLFSIIFIIPVGYIPVLRNFSWSLGFTAQETRSMSFSRTLLEWATDSERRYRPGNWSGDGAGISLFDRQTRQEFKAGGPVSGLFDLRAVNATRRAQGLAPEALAGVYTGTEEENRPAVSRPISGWSAQAREAQSAVAQDVYFGADAAIAVRAAAEQNQSSSDTAALLPRADIAGAALGNDRGWAADTENERLSNALASVLPAAALRNASHADQETQAAVQKPKRDLDAVWRTSLAAQRAPQPVLQKRLASAGYMGAAVPEEIYEGTAQGSGVGLRGRRVTAGFESAEQMQRREEQCREIMKGAEKVIASKLEEAEKLILSLRSVPKTCRADMTGWSANLRSVKTNCKELNEVYNNMKTFCGANVTSGRCETARLDSYESSYNEICTGYENLSAKDQAARDVRLAEASADIDYEVRDSFNLSVNGEEAGGNDFFPTSQF